MITYDESEIIKTVEQLKPSGQLFEVRIILANKKILSGYFRSADKLLKALKTVDTRDGNIYITLNYLQDALFSRQQCEKFLVSKQSTCDHEVEGYEWLFLDFDPVRIAGISSTDEELKKAKDLANHVWQYLDKLGFERPITATSGNGVHLLYRIELENRPDNVELIKNCLKALSFIFDTDDVKVDTANFNPSRICKLYGTLAQKGANNVDRPHRMSKLLTDVHEVKKTPRIFLEKLANLAPKAEAVRPEKYNNYSPKEFNLENWLNEHSIEYSKKSWNDCTKYVLAHCPFDENHKSPDSCIIQQGDGAIGFKCFHDHCQDKKWQDVRRLYEPTAYEAKDDNDERLNGWTQHKATSQTTDVPDITIVAPMFETVAMINARPEQVEEFIPTGVTKMDKALRGLAKGRISLMSGLRGAAKSTLINQVILEARKADYNTICYSGELNNRNFVTWLMLQAAGKHWTVESSKYEGYFYPRPEAREPIEKWLGDKVWLYNNDYGNNFVKLRASLETQIVDKGVDLVILDNLMALNVRDLSPDKYEAQTDFVNVLADMAKRLNVHIMFVAHPRKAQGFLRLDDVSGSADLSNRVDYAFIIHRNNHDFQVKTHEAFGWKDSDPIYKGTNVVEVCKDRDGGTQDLFIPLWFERESKRLKNSEDEYKNYGWELTDGFRTEMYGDDPDIPFA